ncbi:MAG: LacI family DNA-binding transcriptional regulator [Pseudomonadales bacterium]|nr:LacI family DNA-binding transcriptional regulator [Pseudomonadales bacterium]
MTNRAITSFDIAKAAGVSQATVSRALRNSSLVNAETRARIQKIAREMNYSVNRLAANLRTQQTHVLAILLYEEVGERPFEANPFFLSMLGSITHAAADLGYDVLVTFQGEEDDWDHEILDTKRADGVILLGCRDYQKWEDRLRELIESRVRLIFWGPYSEKLSGHIVGCDNIAGGRIATEHLIKLGRRRIMFLGLATETSPEFLARYQGYRQSLLQAGLEPDETLVVAAKNEGQEGYDAVRAVISSGCEFDAIFAATDMLAIWAMKALHEAGLSVPDQVAVIGYDDLTISQHVTPSLTTVRQDVAEAGRILVNNLVGLINDEAVSSALMQPTLIVRDSA